MSDTTITTALPRIAHPTGQANFSRVDVGDLTIWFSYETPIAFWAPGVGKVARENNWGPTTGKHLNEVGVAKADRVPSDSFEHALRKALGGETFSSDPEVAWYQRNDGWV